MNVEMSGSVGDRSLAVGAEVNVLGGSIGKWFTATPGSVVNVEAGRVGDFFNARGAEVNVSGGAVGYFNAEDGTTVNVSAGHVNDLYVRTRSSLRMTGGSGSLRAYESSEATISGGSVSVTAGEGSRVSINGGGIGNLYVRVGSDVTLSGGDFRLDGEAIDAVANELAAVSWPANSRLSGVFSDGTPFVFENQYSVTLSLEPVPVADIGAPTFTASIDTVPFGIRQGQTLVVDAAVNSNFVAGDGSSVNVQFGGRVGDNLRLLDADLLVSDGSIGDDIRAGQTVIVDDGASLTHNLILGNGSKVRVENGGSAEHGLTSIGADMELQGEVGEVRAYLNSTVSVSDGTVDRVLAEKESRVQVSGGSVNAIEANSSYVDLIGGSTGWTVVSNSTVNISGGELGWFVATDSTITLSGGTQDVMHFQVWEYQGESELHILGQEFYLDGIPIDGVANLGNSMLLDVERNDQALTGILTDGNAFRIELKPFAFDGCTSFGCSDFIDHDVTIRLTNAIPEPAGRRMKLFVLLLLPIARFKPKNDRGHRPSSSTHGSILPTRWVTR